MKKTSKKLLSFFLAVVMIVTSCSVGFTAFAKDTKSADTYWNDVTEADEAFEAIGELVNLALPAILGIEIKGSKLCDMINVSQEATLSEVVAGASPLLLDLLGGLVGGAAGGSTDLKAFLIKHTAQTGLTDANWKNKYNKYYSYLTDANPNEGDLTFVELYNLLETGKNSSDTQVAKYCTDTLASLNDLLSVASAAEKSSDSKSAKADDAYKALRTAIGASTLKSYTLDNAKEYVYNGEKLGAITENTKGFDDLKIGIDICNNALKYIVGDKFKANNVAEALMYYYVLPTGYDYTLNNANANSKAITFVNAMLYAKLAEEGGKAISGVTIPTEAPADPFSFAKDVYTKLFDANGSATIASTRSYDTFCSSSFEAINKSILLLSGDYAKMEAVEKAIEEAQISDDDLADLKAHAVEGDLSSLYNYITSADCKLTKYEKEFFDLLYKGDTTHSEFSLFNNELYAGVDNAKAYKLNKATTLRDASKLRNSNVIMSAVDFYNDICSGIMTRLDINSGKNIPSATFISKSSFDFVEVNKYNSDIKPETDKVQYQYEKYVSDSDKAIIDKILVEENGKAVEKVNDIINSLFDESTDIGSTVAPIINGVIGGLLDPEIKPDVLLHDLWKDLYERPMEKVFQLLPALVMLADDLLFPMLFNQVGDANYGTIDNALLQDPTTLLGGLTLKSGNVKIGITSLGFDLNTLLPALLYWIGGDADETYKLVGKYGDYVKANSIDVKHAKKIVITKEKYIDEEGKEKERNKYTDENGDVSYELNKIIDDIPMITGIYVADFFLHYYTADLAKTFEDILLKKNLDDDGNPKMDPALITTLSKGITQAIEEVADFANEAAHEYIDEYGTDENYYKYSNDLSTNAAVAQRGLNNITVALPILVEKIGQKFIDKYDIKSDWTRLYPHWNQTASKTYNKGETNEKTVSFIRNSAIVIFEDYAKSSTPMDPADILDSFMNGAIGTVVNSLLDILNDTISTDNKLTKNLPIVQGLLQGVGGLSETSIIVDLLNGLFGLTREDEASFTLNVQDANKGYVGLSKESAYFLICNISDSTKTKGIYPLIKDVIDGIDKYNSKKYLDEHKNDDQNPVSDPAPAEPAKPKAPTLVSSAKTNKKYETSKLLTKKNVEPADELVSKLDTLLASLLSNTSINDFNINSNDGVLAGLLKAVSNYIGEDQANMLLTVVNEYTKVFDTTAQENGNVDASKVYTEENLSNIVINTYNLVENIAMFLLYSKPDDTFKYRGFLSECDRYQVIGSAILGIISPDAVAVRSGDKIDIKTQSGKNMSRWANVKKINYNFNSGDKKAFYVNLGESFSTIAAILGVVLTLPAEKGNLYSEVLYPVLKTIEKHTGSADVVSPSMFDSYDDAEKLVLGVIAPIASAISQLYKAPVSFIVNLVSSLGELLEDNAFKDLVNGVEAVANYSLGGLMKVIGSSEFLNAPTLASFLGKLANEKTDGIFTKGLILNLSGKLAEKDIIVSLIAGIEITVGGVKLKLGKIVALKPIDWKALANAKTPGEALILVFGYVIDVVLSSPIILGLIKDNVPEILKLIESMDPGKVLALLSAILDIVHSPTEAYWTFKYYAGKITNTFVYPKGITNAEANTAVENLDALVQNVFPLLKDLGVLNYDDLSAIVNDNLFTNEILTKLATTVYGAVDKLVKDNDLQDIIGIIGLDFSPKGVAAILMDESYGKTYSSAAATLKKAKSWDKVKTLNWGFKNGSGKAQKGFVGGLAAILRPLNSVLSILLAESAGLSEIKFDAEAKASVISALKKLTIEKKELTTIKDDSDFGCKLFLEIKDGVLTLTIDSKNSDDDSVVKCNLANVAGTLVDVMNGTELGFGTNGYENAIIPLLEAFLCKNVVDYDTYLADYAKAKDNLLIDVLNPIVGLIDDVLKAPGTTLMSILPNLAYFIDSNGLAQAVANLLAPITGKKGLVGILKKNGLDIDEIIEMIVGKPLGKVVTEALGLNVKLDITISNLAKCNLQDIILPLVKQILKKNNIAIKIPNFTFAQIASHGKIVTAESAAMNSKGEYERKMVVANKGEMFVALLRYVGDVLIKNATALNKLLGNIDAIKKNNTIKDILNCVFSSLKVANKDDIVRAVFYFLTQHGAQDSFFDYSKFITKDYDFSFGNMDEEFCRKLAPMLDGLVSGLLGDKGGVLGLIEGIAYKDEIISSIACGLYGAIEGVSLGDMGSLAELLAKTDIDFTAANVANLLTDSRYGKQFSQPAGVIASAGSWAKVNKDSLKWGVKDRESFLNALVAVLRPVYGVLDVLLNNGALNLFNIVSVPGSNGYTSFIVPLLEAFGVYNIKTQYDYRMDMEKAYDAILLDILNPLLDKVEDILNAPIEMVADILPNLSLFFANNGLLQLIDNLLTPVSALLDAIKPIINVNVVLDVLGVDVAGLLKKIGITANVKIDVYDLQSTLEPVIGSENVVSLLNGILGIIKIGGAPLGLKLPEIDWYKLASHGEVISTTSQVATFGTRLYVQADQDETLIAVLRYLIDTINYEDNYDTIVNLIGGLLGDGVSDSISGVIDQVLGMLQGDADSVIESLVELLQSIAG